MKASVVGVGVLGFAWGTHMKFGHGCICPFKRKFGGYGIPRSAMGTGGKGIAEAPMGRISNLGFAGFANDKIGR